ncbi:MAG: DNA polymerase I, partial [Clostridia bacterium]|nr:DNA polymerase I [Clostridia bacterium]
YGLPDLTNSAGVHTNAVYGFLNIMLKIIEEEQPQYLVVAFDVKAPTFRHEIYKEYKGTRKPAPAEFREQVPLIKEVLLSMQVKMIEKPGLEADDLLGTLAKRAEKEGMAVSLVSGDRDLLQIASDNIKIRMPKTKGGKTEIKDYYAKDVLEEYQVTPLQIIELKALMGDSSDNIPGVPKIGEKTATQLIVSYGTIENLEGHIDEITKKSIRESLQENFELARLSKVLATININAELDMTIEDARISELYTKEAYVLMKKLEFRNLLSRFSQENRQQMQQSFVNNKRLTEPEQLEQLIQDVKNSAHIGIQLITDEELLGLSLTYSEENSYWIECGSYLSPVDLVRAIQTIVRQNPDVTFETFDLKQFYYDIDVKEENPFLTLTDEERKQEQQKTISLLEPHMSDILLAAYLLNPLKSDYCCEDIANEYLGMSLEERKELFGKASLRQIMTNQPEEFLSYVCSLSRIAYQTMPILKERLNETNMLSLYQKIELPLCHCLYDMEVEGIAVRASELMIYGQKLREQIKLLEDSIYEQAGETFNINSPKQLGELLFGKMGIPGGKKTKTGYSTSADVLEKLQSDYPIVADILEYRGLTKLNSTYAEGLAGYIDQSGRIHSHFNQTITATGRISSTEPNLQNIPVRMELGRQIRKVFVPKPGYIFMDADYSQIELRLLAHMSGDKKLIEAYNREDDIHAITASQVFHVPFEEVTPLLRRNAKAVNFGIIYGISSFGLSQDLSISRKEAKEYIEHYFETYPQVKLFLDGLVEAGKKQGYVETMFHRRRPVPELSSSNFVQRSFGERVAMNAPIQGSAADIMKLAMIHVHDRLLKEALKSRIILQVHDELLIETAVDEEAQVARILDEEMKSVAALSVSLEIDTHTGSNWYDAK